MNEELRHLVIQAYEPLKREYGFRVKGRIAHKEDRLLRAVVFHPEKTATRGAYRFDVTLRLGLPGLSSVTSSRREWVISASLGKLHRLRSPRKGRLELTNDRSDEEVRSDVLSLLSDLCSEFLMAVSGKDDLLDLLDNQEEFKRLDLWPWNKLPRLELASVYCAFLGRVKSANQWRERAIQCALDGGMEYAIERINDNVEKALATGRMASGAAQ